MSQKILRLSATYSVDCPGGANGFGADIHGQTIAAIVRLRTFPIPHVGNTRHFSDPSTENKQKIHSENAKTYEVRIGPNELAVLIHLIDHWWQPDAMPWPSKKTLAERLGVSTKTVQRAIVVLEEEGLLLRKERYHKAGGRTSNEYDLSPLVARLKDIAEDMDDASKKAKAVKKAAERPGLKKRSKVAK